MSRRPAPGPVAFSTERLVARRRRPGGEQTGGPGRWALQRRADQRVVGAVALRVLGPPDRVELRWRVARGCRGGGYACEAAAAAIGYAVDVLGRHEIVAAVPTADDRSREIAACAGMAPIGPLVVRGRHREGFAFRVAPVDPRQITVRRADPAEVTALRQRVLRPHQAPSALLADDDAVDVAAVTPEGRVVGCSRLSPEPGPWADAAAATWRLRYMAVAAVARGLGVGRRLVDDALSRARLLGACAVWCAARTPSQGFYARCGFHPVGQPWHEPVLGPHVAMVARLA